MSRFACLALVSISILSVCAVGRADPVTFDARTAHGGRWSDPGTWENGRAPKAGDRVQVRAGHVVTYDINSDVALRMVHVAGTLVFSQEKSTRLDVGLLKIQPGEVCSEDGFVCAVHGKAVEEAKKKPAVPPTDAETSGAGPQPAALEIGTAEHPLPAGVTATVRLVYFDGMDTDALPALVDCGGRMDLHGAPMSRTWIKLGAPAKAGSDSITLAEPVTGWSTGDQVILTSGTSDEDEGESIKRLKGDALEAPGLDTCRITSIDGATIKLDHNLKYAHRADTDGTCEAANLSRNVVVESADLLPAHRGHTMYHRNSTGGISYAEFRHLGKTGVLGKYPIHFHLVRDGFRGSGVIGASIWDSGNRFMAIHGTDYLLVRDCVGFGCIGHGYFLEDGTEQYNILDRNLAVLCRKGRPIKDQALSFDANEGAGFWWANGRNTLTRNVACQNFRYGYRFEIAKVHGKAPVFDVLQPDGSKQAVDVRTIPFLRFEDNESHSNGLYAFDFGDDPNGAVHGDKQHPFIVRNLRTWEDHYGVRPSVSYFLGEHIDIVDGVYGIYHPSYDSHVYRDVRVKRVVSEPINRGHDDESIQWGSFTYDGLRMEQCSGSPIIQLTCTSPNKGQSGHFRNVSVDKGKYQRVPVVDLGVGPILKDSELKEPVPYYFHDFPVSPGSGKTLKVMSVKYPGDMKDGDYKPVPGFTGPRVKAAEVDAVPFPELLAPVDDLPPASAVTSIRREGDRLIVHGITQDNGDIAGVAVNGHPAKLLAQHAGVADWEAALDGAGVTAISAAATDAAGNVEKMPARAALPVH